MLKRLFGCGKTVLNLINNPIELLQMYSNLKEFKAKIFTIRLNLLFNVSGI